MWVGSVPPQPWCRAARSLDSNPQQGGVDTAVAVAAWGGCREMSPGTLPLATEPWHSSSWLPKGKKHWEEDLPLHPRLPLSSPESKAPIQPHEDLSSVPSKPFMLQTQWLCYRTCWPGSRREGIPLTPLSPQGSADNPLHSPSKAGACRSYRGGGGGGGQGLLTCQCWTWCPRSC